MWFFQRIRFRIMVGAIFLVAAVAIILGIYIQNRYKKELNDHAMHELRAEANLRAHEVISDIQNLAERVLRLVSGAPLRTLQYKMQLVRGIAAPNNQRTPEQRLQEAEEAKQQVARDFENLFRLANSDLPARGKDMADLRPSYLRIEYFFVEKPDSKPERLVCTDQQYLPGDMKDLHFDDFVNRVQAARGPVVFSTVQKWENLNGSYSRDVFQVGYPVYFAGAENPPGFVIVTVDFGPQAQSLTRSPRYLVFLADAKQRLLLYPREGRSPARVLTLAEADAPECRSFVKDWLTVDDGLQPDRNAKGTYRASYRFDEDNWLVDDDLKFRLLRIRVKHGIQPENRDRLLGVVQTFLDQNDQLFGDKEMSETNELLIRGPDTDATGQLLHKIRADVKEQFGSDVAFPDWQPIVCTRFLRILYKFRLGHDSNAAGDQYLYFAMAFPRDEIDATIDNTLWDIGRVVIWCMLAAIAIAILGSFLLTRPLNAITRATRDLAEGRTDVHLPVQDPTEIGVLARSFALMIGQIQQRQQEIVEREAHLKIANAGLAEAAISKDLFLATVSHELRTPLNHVIGFVQLLEMTSLDDEQLRDLGKIHNAADNLLALVNDLLDYQKIIQGALTLEPADFDLASWATEVAETMSSKVAEKGNRLVVDCPADLGVLYADEKRVRQALTNLLTNAAKFTRDGVITVSARREQTDAGSWVCIDVTDSGRGMTPEQQQKLFQPFTKLLSRNENPEGTGLGLALSQKLCRLMGGDLTLTRSAPDQGSTFTVRLPAQTTANAPLPPSTSTTRPTPANGPTSTSKKVATVLVIDDDPDVQELMRRHLEGQGFVIHTADSGAAGLELVKKLRPDAITLDVLMPGIDGWGTLAALQADAETSSIPVILITMLDDRTRGFALGAWEFMPKPIDWSRLIDLLRNLSPSTGPVLLVDDDPKFRELASRTLINSGWEVCCAEDGRVALAAASRRRPGLVLLDLVMPNMDGFEFLAAFRQDSTWRDVPVVVVTGKDLTPEDLRRLDGSVQKILYKGMGSLEDLLREVEWLLHNHTQTARPGGDPVAVVPGLDVTLR